MNTQTLLSDRTDEDILMTPPQTAQMTGLTERGLEGMRYKGGGPPFIRISARCVRYRRGDLLAWIESRRRNSTSDDGQAA